MLLIGHTSSADATSTTDAVADRIYTSQFSTTSETVLVSKLSVRVDGGGPVNGSQAFRAVIYSDSGELLGEGTEVIVDSLATVEWVDFPFPAPVRIDASIGTVHIGLHASATSTGCRLYRTDSGTSLSTLTDTYEGGAETTGFAASNSTGELAVFATFAYPWTPADEEDEYLANLAFPSAQVALGTTGDPRTKRRAYATWHGTFLDPQPQGASVAIVQSNGPLSDLVGERLLVSGPPRRSVTVYVHRETDLDLDDDTQISLSRRAWQALAPLGDDTLLVTVEVVGENFTKAEMESLT